MYNPATNWKLYEVKSAELLKRELANLQDDRDVPWKSYPCLEWERAKTVKGYGYLWIDGRMRLAHRAAYKLSVGPIPEGYLVCHKCDNPACFRPSHLFVGTALDNKIDRTTKGRSNRGERHQNAKLTEEQIRIIRLEHASGVKRSKLALRFGVLPVTIGDVVSRKSWRHIDGRPDGEPINA